MIKIIKIKPKYFEHQKSKIEKKCLKILIKYCIM